MKLVKIGDEVFNCDAFERVVFRDEPDPEMVQDSFGQVVPRGDVPERTVRVVEVHFRGRPDAVEIDPAGYAKLVALLSGGADVPEIEASRRSRDRSAPS